MFCPRCGQEQATQDVHYCSRCGLRLTLIKDLLTANGSPEPHYPLEKRDEWFFRKSQYRRGAKMLFTSLVLFPIMLIFGLATGQPEPLVILFILFFISVVWLLYRRLFYKEESRVTTPAAFGNNQAQAYLNPPSLFATPVSDTRIKTAEMIPPPSVTESTTRKLKER